MSLGLIPHRRPYARAIRRWDPWRLLDDFEALPSLPVARPAVFTPRVDVTETDEAYELHAELAGLEEKDFEVVLEADVLTLKGEKRDDREESAKGRHRSESSYGRFERRFRFPVEILADEVKAEYRNGVLRVRLPKVPEARPDVRTIPIRTS